MFVGGEGFSVGSEKTGYPWQKKGVYCNNIPKKMKI
jgi:hypothetical protein